MGFLEDYYSHYDEEGRLLSRHGQVEYLTTMKYIEESLHGISDPEILEIGAGTGRYSVTLAKRGFKVTAVELIAHNLDALKSKLDGSESLVAVQEAFCQVLFTDLLTFYLSNNRIVHTFLLYYVCVYQIGICRYVLMKRIDNDTFYDSIKQYDPDSEYHLVGEVDYHLLSDDKPYEGMKSHKEALRVVFDCLVKQSIENMESARIMFGDDLANKLRPLVYDIDKAQPAPLDRQVFFYCPNIVKTDYYGSVWYDAEWKPDDENFGTTVPYWYALMEPVHGRRNKPEDFKKVNEVLFPNGTDALDIYEWATDWSDFFDDGHEWYGACCWSVYDKTLNRYVVMLVSATD